MPWSRQARALTALAALLFASLASPPTRAGSDPARQWFTITTEHFAIHSYDGGEKLARRAAAFAEDAYRRLTPLLGWAPEERVEISLVDDVDSANGWATVAPFNHVRLFAYPPAADGSLSYYDDWLRILVFHEYAHIAHIDNATGIPRVVNTVLGKSLKPNQAVPRWLTEGLATWVETHTGEAAGRVGSARFDMILRTAALAKQLPDLSAIGGPPLTQPGTTSWYMYGGYLFDHIARTRGADSIKKFAHAYGRRLIPYSMNIIARDTMGADLVTLYDETLAEIRKRAEATAARVRAEGVVEGRRFTVGGEHKQHPRWSPDGRWLAYVRGDGHRPGALVRVPAKDLRPGRWEEVLKCDGGCGRFDFSGDGAEIIVATGRHHRRVNFYTELLKVPFRPGQTARDGRLLTTAGSRSTDPRVQRDGRAIWVAQSAWGETWLRALHPLDGRPLARWDAPAWGRLTTPVPSPDGRVVYASMHAGGNQDLYAIDPAKGEAQRLTEGASMELDLAPSPDGRWLLYSSDATGVYNIYARRLADGHTVRLTNVLGGAFSPAVSPDGNTLVYAGWGVDGYDLYVLPFAPDAAPTVTDTDPRPARAPVELPSVESARQPYTPLPTMLPRNWFPTYVADTTGLSRIGLLLGGLDVTERLASTIAFEYDIPREDFSASLALDISLGWPDLSLVAGRYSWDRRTFFGDRFEPYREEVYYARANVSLPVPSVLVPLSLSAGYTVDVSRALEQVKTRHTPDEFSPFVPREGFSTRLDFSFGFSDVEQPKWSVGPAWGGSGRVAFSLRHPTIGSDTTSWSITYLGRRYVPMPWHPEHVLALRFQGGWSGGESPGGFALGGVPEQDWLVDLANERQAAAAWLRGYEPAAFSGTAFHLWTAEYRLPLWRLRGGLDTLPLFVRDLHAAIFSDVGVAHRGVFDVDTLDAVRASIGIELRLDVGLLFGFLANFRVGYARGLGPEGIDQVYLLMAPQP